MNIIKVSIPSQDIINQINFIVEKQNKERALPLYFDFEDECCIYYLCYDNEKLMSVLALFEIDSDIYEAIAYTDIDYRKKGYFKSLLSYINDDLPSDIEISFLCDIKYPPAVETAKKLSLIYDCTETMMVLDLYTYKSEKHPYIEILKEDDIFYIYYKEDEIGSFCFDKFSSDADDIYFHNFIIYEEYRNRGLGKLSMKAILDFLKALGKSKIHLQLLLENTPAYKIYAELGFRIVNEISYYK